MEKSLFEKIKVIFFSFMLYCFIGWIYEVILEFSYGHGFVNRGFLHGPYLPVYGFGALLVLFTIRPFSRKRIHIGKILITPVIVFLLIFVLVTVVEYCAGVILDVGFGKQLWDYSDEILNINGIVCLFASLKFATGGTVFLYLLQPLFEKFIGVIPKVLANVLFVLLFTTIFVDFLVTVL